MAARIFLRRRWTSFALLAGCATVAAEWGFSENSAGAAEATRPSAAIARGRELFTRAWIPGDPRSRGGDGLGPMFNDTSCIGCHSLGGIGGAGPSGKNVQIVARGATEPELAARIHPALLTQDSTVLHRHSVSDEYAAWRKARLDRASTDQRVAGVMPQALFEGLRRGVIPAEFMPRGQGQAAKPNRKAKRADADDDDELPLDASFSLQERNTTALFGAGLIDAIPEAALEELARQQARVVSPRGMSLGGRIVRLEDGRIGRFGWKSQRATLADFTLGACAIELGLDVFRNAQSIDPRSPDEKAPGLDMNRKDCQDLVAFVRALPPPEQATTEEFETQVAHGGQLFRKIGCAVCHVPDVAEAKGIYSDLLVHDMGASLSGAGAYYGRQIPSPGQTAARQATPPSASEWRTPPLWGCRDSGPYMHDGRAETLREAIALHTGQGAESAGLFAALARHDQQKVISFLESLTAPAAPNPVQIAEAKLSPKR